MAPKRKVRVLKTTKKVVEEIVEVVSIVGDSQNGVEVLPGDSKFVEVVVEAKDAQSPEEDLGEGKEGRPQAGEEEPSREKEAEPPFEKSIVQQEETAGEGKEAESIADKETQEEAADEGKDKEAEPRTPKKVEQTPEREMEEPKDGGEGMEAEKGRKKQGRAGGRRKRRKKRFSGSDGGEMDGTGRGYKRYVFRVLKQVRPGMGISSRAMAVLDGMMGDMFERLADEASRLATYTGKATLSSREMQGAVQLVLPGELCKHAISEATKAVSNYMAADRHERR
ncbi:hypothetical protein OPV22_009543 [Ensete ventricosum]|uniref:Core Histone H2A/H2B/H3 domain-containing protein n=1 Tax=Ensete ventricosum TaxID=4639 RepID=A0AAV8R941_ENSVE|nr:hypothetical protein OPV22_009543 [Ensete ventricosum]RWW60514.1 hypothetical protein BHE74_00032490 [Ensete ventricosum]RZS09985.1 hypothetical protein BHM03_00041119 [Ensete ventricosum]